MTTCGVRFTPITDPGLSPGLVDRCFYCVLVTGSLDNAAVKRIESRSAVAVELLGPIQVAMEEREMNRMLVSSAALLIVAAAVSEAADVKSGLRPGQGVQAFNVQDITGPFAGKKLCYR